MRGELKALIIRHRFTLADLGMIALIVVAALVGIWLCDVFPNESAETRALIFELDEIFAVCALAFALFSWSRLRAQRREIHRRRLAEAQARALSLEDPLTGLPNRRQFEEALVVALASPPGADAVHAIMMLDLNGFKAINDVHGHPVGDEALIQVAIRLRGAVRDGDLIARLGGDEFAVLSRHVAGPEAAAGLAARILKALDDPVRTGAGEHRVGSGIGIALMPADGAAAEGLIRKADVALYRAKAEGRSVFRFFESEMDQVIQERERLEAGFRAAIGSSAVGIVYHPLVDLADGRVIGFEARPRWHHPELGPIAGARLLAIAESAHLARDFTDDFLARACADAARWPGTVALSVSLTHQVLRDETFPLRLIALLSRCRLDPTRLELAVPESTLVADLRAATRVLGTLAETGVRLAVTQFGTGYSSLYHLNNFPLNAIKIDRSFVEAMDRDPRSAAIVRALVGLGAGLGLTVGADGVQDERQQALLAEQGCRHAQGALFSEVLSSDEACRLVAGARAAGGATRRTGANDRRTQ